MWKKFALAMSILALHGASEACATEVFTDTTICVKWVDEETAKAMQSGIPPELSAIGCSMLWTSTVVPQWSVLRVPAGQCELAVAVATQLP